MKKKFDETKWRNEFLSFLDSEDTSVPPEISNKILQTTQKLVNPSAWMVFLKLAGTHVVVGSLSLAVCSQFGLNPFNTKLSLADYFMEFGESFCMAGCGFLFIGLSLLASKLILTHDEFNVLRKNLFVQLCSLSLLSLVAFMAFGAHITLGLGLLWYLGALAGGSLPVLTLAYYKGSFSR